MRRVVFTLSTVFTVSCGLVVPQDKNLDPNSKEMKKLVEPWKDSLIKGCVASDVAGVSETPATDNIDIRSFLDISGGSIFQTEDGSVFALVGYDAPTGESRSSYESSVEVNGHKSGVEISTKRTGSHCIVSAGDQIIYETNLATNLVLQVLSRPNLPKLEPIYATSAQVTSKGDAYGLVHHQFENIVTALNRDYLYDDSTLLKHISLTKKQAQRFIGSARSESLSSANISVPQLNVSNFSSFANTIYALSPGEFQSIFDKSNLTIRYEVAPTNFEKTFDLNSDTFSSLVVLEYKIQTSRLSNGGIQIDLLETARKNDIPKSSELFKKCFKNRFELLKYTVTNRAAVYPYYYEVTSPCENLTVDSSLDLFEDLDLRNQVILRFAGVDPSFTEFGYEGWESPLKEMFKRCALPGESRPSACLGQSAIGPFFEMLDEYYATLSEELPKNYSLLNTESILSVDLAFSWTIAGEVVDQILIKKVAQAIEKTSGSLAMTQPSIVSTVRYNPKESESILDFVLDMSPSHFDALTQLIERTQELGLASKLDSKFNSGSIVDMTPEPEIVRALSTVEAIATFLADEKKLQSESTFSSASATDNITTRAAKELWAKEQFDALKNMAKLAKYKSICKNEKTISLQIYCMDENLFSVEQGKFFDPEFNYRYVDLSDDFVTYQEDLISDLSMSWKLTNAFPDKVVWQQCDNEEFASKRVKLRTVMTAYVKSDGFEKFELSSLVDDTLEDCDVEN